MTATAVTRPARSWACPDAQLILPYDAPRDLWLAERRKGLGGSDASTIAGVNRFSSRYAVWLDKTGDLPEQDLTAAMRMGNLLEPVLIRMFTEDTGIEVRRAASCSPRPTRSCGSPWTA